MAGHTASPRPYPFVSRFTPYLHHGVVTVDRGSKVVNLGIGHDNFEVAPCIVGGATELADAPVLAWDHGPNPGEFTLSIADASAETAVAAELDLTGLTTHVNVVVRARHAGVDGDNITLSLIPGAAANAGVLTESGNAVTFQYKTGGTTVTQFQTAIGTSTLLEVKTTGTGANILATTGDDLAATNLAGGVGSGATTYASYDVSFLAIAGSSVE